MSHANKIVVSGRLEWKQQLQATANILHFLKCSHTPALGSAVPGSLQLPPRAGELHSKGALQTGSNKVQPAMEHPQQLHSTAKSFSCDPTNCSVNHVSRVRRSICSSIEKNPNHKHGTPKNIILLAPESFQHNCEQMADFS